MKLLLTSAGLRNKKVADFLVSILPKPPGDCSVLVVADAEDVGERSYVGMSQKKLRSLGFTKISFFNLTDDKFTNASENFDVIYVLGGGTHEILNRLRVTGLAEFIIGAVRNHGTVYFGSSASSIVAGPDITIASWGSDPDPNEIGLEDLRGLGLTNMAIYPHFRPDLEEEVAEFRQMVDYPVIALADDEAVFVDDSGYRRIS